MPRGYPIEQYPEMYGEMEAIESVEEKVVKKKYLKCPFCGRKDDQRRGDYVLISWCVNGCGRAYDAVWYEEDAG